MSYLVLAVGAILALGGAVALFTSYGIILVERGWAGVIAGTTALASGVVTIALGLILHRLASVHALLRTTFTGLPAAQDLAEDGTAASSAAQLPHYVPKAAMPLEPASTPAGGPSAAGLRSWPQRQPPRSPHPSGRGIFKSRGTVLPPPPRNRDPAAAPPQPPFSSPDDLPSQYGAAPDGGPEHGLEAGLPAAGGGAIDAVHNVLNQSGLAEGATAEDPRAGTPLNEQSPVQTAGGSETPAQPLVAGMPPEPGEPPEHLSPHVSPADAALIETILQGEGRAAYGSPSEASKDDSEKPLPAATDETSPRPPAAPFAPQGGDHPAATAFGNELPAGDAFSGAALAIVGRYESQGTSYIMYADGSIEARTNHAVIHFKSLDELKSFLESQALISKE
jgi:hypothetical protein